MPAESTFDVTVVEEVTNVTIANPDNGETWSVDVAEQTISVVSVGIQGPEGPASVTYVHTQSVASDEWVIDHNLDRYPSVSVVDSAGNVIHANVNYITADSLTVEFTAMFSGKAYLN